MKDALRKLADLMRKAADENELLQEGLDPDVLEAIRQNKLTPEMLKKLGDALKEGQKGEAMKMGKLVRAKLIDPGQLMKGKEMDKDGKEALEGLAAYLKDALGKDGMDDDDGKGGTDRGGGKTKLTFGDESTEDGVTFKEQELPTDRMNLKDSSTSGISKGAPNIGKEKAEKGQAGALTGSRMGGGSAATQAVLPRHRGAVERYFDRNDKTKR
jgi:hypothetical protein